MNIALIGYGKMGQAIEQVAQQRGHTVVLRITSANTHQLTPDLLQKADVAIEFTRPESALANVLACLATPIPVVCGTTGWNESLPLARKAAIDGDTAFLHASNFSVGVNIFFEVNAHLARLMGKQTGYGIQMEEIHHTHKKDAPSGTAITLAEQILPFHPEYTGWSLDNSEPAKIPITAVRMDEVPGTHTITYTSPIDTLEITHVAHTRNGFAIGAVLAAEFLVGRKGIYTIKDVLFGDSI